MTAIELIRDQFKSAHETLEATVADLTQERASYKQLGKAIPAGAAYAHAVISEDIMLSRMFAQTDPVFTDAESAGLSEAMPSMDEWSKHEEWYQTVKVDLPKFREYAKKVYQATDDYLSGLTDDDLDTIIDRPVVGKQKLAFLLSNFFILHTANLTGEISAAKGVQGLKGYPW